MKDIEQRLGNARTSEPRRRLARDFTDVTMGRVYATGARKSMFSWFKPDTQGRFTMHKLTKPAAIAIALAVVGVTAGTGYAALKWLQPKSTLDKNSITTLANGNIRFWIHSDSCQGQESDGPSDSYFEIKAGSKITPEALRKSIEASCESDLLRELFPEVITASTGPKGTSTFRPGNKQYYLPWVQIKAIENGQLVIQGKLNGKDYPITQLPIDSDAHFYSKGQPIKLSDLKAGDWVTLVSYTTSLDKPFSTETLTPEQLEPLVKDGFPIGTRVTGMIKHQYDPNTSIVLSGVPGEDWTRLVPDSKSPDGWKQLVPFDHDWKKYEESYKN